MDPNEQVDILYDMICAGYQEGGKDSCQVLLDQLFALLCTFPSTHLHTQTKQGPVLKITCLVWKIFSWSTLIPPSGES